MGVVLIFFHPSQAALFYDIYSNLRDDDHRGRPLSRDLLLDRERDGLFHALENKTDEKALDKIKAIHIYFEYQRYLHKKDGNGNTRLMKLLVPKEGYTWEERRQSEMRGYDMHRTALMLAILSDSKQQAIESKFLVACFSVFVEGVCLLEVF